MEPTSKSRSCRSRYGALLSLLTISISGSAKTPHAAAIPLASTQVEIVSIHPHNTTAFTEGFLFVDGRIVESTGLPRHSFIRQYKLPSASSTDPEISYPSPSGDETNNDEDEDDGSNSEENDEPPGAPPAPVAPSVGNKILNEYKFDAAFFGEGIACIGDQLFALTYKQNKILVLSKTTFELQSSHPFHTSTGEGWGMTTDGKHLIVSDGSSSIQFFDPKQNFKRVGAIKVTTEDGEPVEKINELEFVEGEILANVWFQNVVLRIDPRNGHVIETLDFDWLPAMVPNIETLADSHMRNEAVMNGIAYNPQNGHVYVTGKLWDSIFELEFSYLKHHHHRQQQKLKPNK